MSLHSSTFLVLMFIVSLTSCKYGRPLVSYEKENIRTEINDTITEETVFRFHTFRKFKFVDAYFDDVKYYNQKGELLSHYKSRESPAGMKDGNVRKKSKKTFYKDGKKDRREIEIEQNFGRHKYKSTAYYGRCKRRVFKKKWR